MLYQTTRTRDGELSITPYLVLTDQDYRVLGPQDFGAPGLRAIESIGPFVNIQAVGPLITVHDSVIEPGKGIGHHPHRMNERLFYILAGELDHDDALNGIRGHMSTGDVGLFTEGRRGMLHSEWNHGDTEAHAYILVYVTDPVPEETAFTVFPDGDAPRYQEGEGVHTKELVGPSSWLRVHGDIRLFTDSTLETGRSLSLMLDEGEGGLLSIRTGQVRLDEHVIDQGSTVLAPPARGKRQLIIEAASPARVLRVVYGPGYGLLLRRV